MTGLVRCAGRRVRRSDCQPVGPACFAVYAGAVDSARVLGWRISEPDADGNRQAMCPQCGRPGAGDPEDSGPAVLEPLPGM